MIKQSKISNAESLSLSYLILPSFFPQAEPPRYQNQPPYNLEYGIHTYPCNNLMKATLNKPR